MLRDHSVNTSLHKHVLYHPTNNKSVFFIFANIQKATNTLNLLTNPICEIHIFYFSYRTVIFFHWQIKLTYLHDKVKQVKPALVTALATWDQFFQKGYFQSKTKTNEYHDRIPNV